MQRALHVSASKPQMIPNFKKKALLESISKNITTELLIKTAVRIVCSRQLTPESDFLVTYIIRRLSSNKKGTVYKEKHMIPHCEMWSWITDALWLVVQWFL